MVVNDIVVVVGPVLVVGGWIYNKWKDRSHEIFKERLKRRLEMYDCMTLALLPFLNLGPDGSPQGENLKEKLESARTKVQLYGYSDEIAAYEKLVAAINQRDFQTIKEMTSVLASMIRKKLRLELGYGKEK